MIHWKVVRQKFGHIGVFGGGDLRQVNHKDKVLWEGDAWDNHEALFKAYQHNPDIDMVAMRLRSEMNIKES